MPAKKKEKVYGQIFIVDLRPKAVTLWDIDGEIQMLPKGYDKAAFNRAIASVLIIKPDADLDPVRFMLYLSRNGYAELRRRMATSGPIASPVTVKCGISPELLELGPPTPENAEAYAALAAADAAEAK
jgi:hypothetical protein